MNSQNISNDRVKTFINDKGETFIQFNLKDARTILVEILDKEYADSLLTAYMVRDIMSQDKIELQVIQIRALQTKIVNNEKQVANLNKMLVNSGKENVILLEDVKKKEKEIKKQTRLKKLGFLGAIVLPIIVLLI